MRPHALSAFVKCGNQDALGRAGLVQRKRVALGDCPDAASERVKARNRVSGQRVFKAFVCEV